MDIQILDNKSIQFNWSQISRKFKEVLKDFIFSFKNIQILKAIANLSSHSGFHKAIKDYLQPVIQTFALSIPIMLAFTEKQKSAVLIGIFYFIPVVFGLEGHVVVVRRTGAVCRRFAV